MVEDLTDKHIIPDVGVWKNGKYLLGWKGIKVFGFFTLFISTLIHLILDDVPDSLYKILDDPFPIGVGTIFAGSLFNWIQHYNKNDIKSGERIEFYTMTFFIVTKLISQITHAAHGKHTGIGLSENDEHFKTVEQTGGNIFKGFSSINRIHIS